MKATLMFLFKKTVDLEKGVKNDTKRTDNRVLALLYFT